MLMMCTLSGYRDPADPARLTPDPIKRGLSSCARERERERGREGGREGEREGGREGGREGISVATFCWRHLGELNC